jgi:hypothetical protein
MYLLCENPGCLNLLEPSGPVKACTGIALACKVCIVNFRPCAVYTACIFILFINGLINYTVSSSDNTASSGKMVGE